MATIIEYEVGKETLKHFLIQAIDESDLEGVKELLSKGVDPNGMPMIMAIQSNEPEILKLLIDAGADVNQEFANTTLLVRATTSTHPEMAKVLIEAGANVNQKAQNGYTPLSGAKKSGRINATDQERTFLIKILVESGATEE